MVRPGALVYGLRGFHKGYVEVTQAMAFKTRISQLHRIKAGEGVGYDYLWRAARDSVIATLPFGYADGYPRSLSMRGSVLIRGQRAPILGRVCMQMCIVDVTDIPGVEPGDTAYLLGGSGPLAIRPEELAEWWGTISYEVFCALGRNRRVSEKKFSEYSNRRA